MSQRYRPIGPDHQIRKIVQAMQTRLGLWTDPQIQQAFKRQNPDDPFREGRAGGFRNQMQRFCPTAARHTEGGIPYAPLFANPTKGHWYLAMGFGRYLSHSPSIDCEDEQNALAVVEDELEAVLANDKALSASEREATIKARVGQGTFANNVKQIESCCRITKITAPQLLRASHIKPWAACETYSERIDGNNGLWLDYRVDNCFDRGFITFGDDGRLILSDQIDTAEFVKMGIKEMNVGTFNARQRLYLAYHREVIFK